MGGNHVYHVFQLHNRFDDRSEAIFKNEAFELRTKKDDEDLEKPGQQRIRRCDTDVLDLSPTQ